MPCQVSQLNKFRSCVLNANGQLVGKLTSGCKALMGEWLLLDDESLPGQAWGLHGVDVRPPKPHPVYIR